MQQKYSPSDLDYKSIILSLYTFTLHLSLLGILLIFLVFSTFFLFEINLIEAITILGDNFYL